MAKIDVLKATKFGSPVAEDERESLKEYFLQTELWGGVLSGEVDLILGPKGSGKSALFLLLQDHTKQLKDRNIAVTSAENLRGDVAFKNLAVEPPPSEREIELIWRLYFLSLTAQNIHDTGTASKPAKEIIKSLKSASLVKDEKISLGQLLGNVRRAASAILRPKSVSGTFSIDPNTGMPIFGSSIEFKDSVEIENTDQIEERVNSIFGILNDALDVDGRKIWILLDRLDVAFEENQDLEKNALRALIRAYLNIKAFSNISLKIFLRSDIYSRITQEGFREATHVTKERSISWNRDSIQNIIIRRAISNPEICDMYSVKKMDVERDAKMQERLFYRIFPEKVEGGPKTSKTLDWILKRLSDGNAVFCPRDVIILLNKLSELQARKIELGSKEPDAELLFDRSVFKEAYRAVSEQKRDKVLFAEYPSERKRIEAIRGTKCEFSIGGLAHIWKIGEEEARIFGDGLVEIGFFEKRGDSHSESYVAAFVYRAGLDLKQGRYSFESSN
jgi:energy-coupling factor transporter ATP-binding protein EcfA2